MFLLLQQVPGCLAQSVWLPGLRLLVKVVHMDHSCNICCISHSAHPLLAAFAGGLACCSCKYQQEGQETGVRETREKSATCKVRKLEAAPVARSDELAAQHKQSANTQPTQLARAGGTMLARHVPSHQHSP
jgi:hypothetical protein